jgi:hypothetical protein
MQFLCESKNEIWNGMNGIHELLLHMHMNSNE